jgi:hypothetical protein
MALHCKNIEERIHLALKLGWTIKSNVLLPPKHFECSKNQWAAIYEKVDIHNSVLSMPHWFNDDFVLTTGSRNDIHI